jgi:hypothetical protein
VDWIKLAHDKDKWWALANTVINNIFHKRRGISRVCENIIRPSTESDNMQRVREGPNKETVAILKLQKKIVNRWK